MGASGHQPLAALDAPRSMRRAARCQYTSRWAPRAASREGALSSVPPTAPAGGPGPLRAEGSAASCGPSGAPPLAALDVLGPVLPAHRQVAAASCRPTMATPFAALSALAWMPPASWASSRRSAALISLTMRKAISILERQSRDEDRPHPRQGPI